MKIALWGYNSIARATQALCIIQYIALYHLPINILPFVIFPSIYCLSWKWSCTWSHNFIKRKFHCFLCLFWHWKLLHVSIQFVSENFKNFVTIIGTLTDLVVTFCLFVFIFFYVTISCFFSDFQQVLIWFMDTFPSLNVNITYVIYVISFWHWQTVIV